jgi:tetratricopeptide (TPR) repeat protein
MKLKLPLIALVTITALPVWAQPQLNKSRQLVQQGKFQEALTELRKITRSSSRTNEAYYLMADAFIGLNLPDSTIALGQRLRDSDGKSPAGYVVMARGYMAKKDSKEAHETLTKGKNSTKGNAEVLTQFGQLYLVMDSTNQAVVAFSQAKVANPNYAPSLEGLGDAYLKMGSPGMAILQYESYAKLDSTDAALLDKLAKTYQRERRYTDVARTCKSRPVGHDRQRSSVYAGAPLFPSQTI